MRLAFFVLVRYNDDDKHNNNNNNNNKYYEYDCNNIN
nr:MAG TPA: hypothetical protein [Crassvirales sp.]